MVSEQDRPRPSVSLPCRASQPSAFLLSPGLSPGFTLPEAKRDGKKVEGQKVILILTNSLWGQFLAFEAFFALGCLQMTLSVSQFLQSLLPTHTQKKLGIFDHSSSHKGNVFSSGWPPLFSLALLEGNPQAAILGKILNGSGLAPTWLMFALRETPYSPQQTPGAPPCSAVGAAGQPVFAFYLFWARLREQPRVSGSARDTHLHPGPPRPRS